MSDNPFANVLKKKAPSPTEQPEPPSSPAEKTLGETVPNLDKSRVSSAVMSADRSEGKLPLAPIPSQPSAGADPKELSGKVDEQQSAPPMSRKGSQLSAGSRRDSQAGSQHSRQASMHGGSAGSAHPDEGSQASGMAPRAASQYSHRSAVSVNLTEVMRENEKLKAQIESLQRLYASGNQESMIHRLKDDLQHKAVRVKELEKHLKESQEEAKKWRTEAQSHKKEKKKKGKDDIHHHDSEIVEKNGRINQLEKALAESQREAAHLRESLAAVGDNGPTAMASKVTSNSDGPAPPITVGGQPVDRASVDVRPYLEEIASLKQQGLEKDLALSRLNDKLTKAQEAILGSAGVGWENHVKLHQTKGMLTKIIQSSPRKEDRMGSASPPPAHVASASPGVGERSRSRPEMSPPPVHSSRTEFRALEDNHGVLRLWKLQGDSRSVITSIQCTNGVIYDQTGAVLNISDSGEGGGEISKLSALADLCRIPHSLPVGPVVVVAGHTVSASPRAASHGSFHYSPARLPSYY
eukprot:TRINITY_DN15544_c0_g1_i1.p1 TRINITY_DN15544_c0_g1~~TRINITY_DN15544_c0_g1_i1.p1  ORF type:complete len:523 (+),score=153.61 TRINITY_DN15544_c0_g1_i1:87-1655(+)